MKFIRYGSLVPQHHKINERNRSFHTPPVEYGFYAFPYGYVENFLLGGTGAGSLQNGRYRFLKDSNGNKLKAKYSDIISVEMKKDYTGDYQTTYTVKPAYVKLLKQQNIKAKDIRQYFVDKDNILCDAFDAVNLPDGYDIYDDDLALDDIETYFVIENKPNIFEYNSNVWCHFIDCVKPNEVIKQIDSWILIDIKLYKKTLQKYLNKIKHSRFAERTKYEKMSNGNPSGYPISYFSKDEFEVYIEKL